MPGWQRPEAAAAWRRLHPEHDAEDSHFGVALGALRAPARTLELFPRGRPFPSPHIAGDVEQWALDTEPLAADPTRSRLVLGPLHHLAAHPRLDRLAFDLVFSANGLWQHTRSPEDTLRDVVARLVDGGAFWLRLPGPSAIAPRHRRRGGVLCVDQRIGNERVEARFAPGVTPAVERGLYLDDDCWQRAANEVGSLTKRVGPWLVVSTPRPA